MPRPKLGILEKDDIERIFTAALSILNDTGVKIEDDLVRDYVLKNGGVLKNDRITFDESLVKEALKKAPKEFALYDRDGKYVATLGQEARIFNPGSAAIYILDYGAKEVRTPRLKDLKDFVIVTDYLDNIDAQSTALVPSDVPDEVKDISRLYVVIKYSRKPVITGAFTIENLGFMLNLMKAVREDYNKRPWAIFDVTVSSPLSWSKITARNLYDLAKNNVPAEIISMPQIGATSPATIAGSLVLHTAEILSGIVIAELVNSGAPIIYGGSTAVSQPRYGTPLLTAPESVLLTLAYGDIAKYLNLPSHTYMGLSDNKIVDYQAGAETMYSAVLAAIAGFDIISGPGMMENEMTQSIEKLVLDNEVVGFAKTIVRGFNIDDESLALNVIRSAVNKRHFLSEPHTRRHVRELYMYRIFDSTSRSTWDGKAVYEKAHEKVLEIIKTYNPPTLPNDVLKELDSAYSLAWKYHNLSNPITI